MEYFQVANWDTLQHYKDRSPPWIKLHNSLLDDYNFSCLQDASKMHLIAIMMLASRTDNKLPTDAQWLRKQISATCEVDIIPLIEAGFLELIESDQEVTDASKTLAERLQVASPEREESRDREEKRQRVKSSRFTPPSQSEVHEYMKEKGQQNNVEAETFVDFYASKNWMVGRNKMKDWKAAVRNWLKRSNHNKPQEQERSSERAEYLEKKYGDDANRGSLQNVNDILGNIQ